MSERPWFRTFHTALPTAQVCISSPGNCRNIGFNSSAAVTVGSSQWSIEWRGKMIDPTRFWDPTRRKPGLKTGDSIGLL
jgi:hypothetical protein